MIEDVAWQIYDACPHPIELRHPVTGLTDRYDTHIACSLEQQSQVYHLEVLETYAMAPDEPGNVPLILGRDWISRGREF
ncbi:MAG: hypothetical protein ACR2RF_19775 [Geminicoccaceae bacterium]